MALTKPKGAVWQSQDNYTGINVRDEGAYGDNSHDDTTAILSAVTKWSTYKLPLIFPSGTYLFDGLSISASKFKIIGLGTDVILKHTGTGSALTFDGSAGAISNCAIDNITIQGNINTTNAFKFHSCHHISARDLRARDCVTGFKLQWVVEGSWNNISCSSNEQAFSVLTPTNGIYIAQAGEGYYSVNNTFINATIEGVSGRGIYLYNASDNTFVGGTSEDNGIGIGIETAARHNRRNAFHNFWCENNSSSDVELYGNQNTFHGCYFGSTNPLYYNVNILPPGTHNAFYDCYIRAAYDQAVTTQTAYYNCSFPDNGSVALISPTRAARIINCRRVDNSADYTTKYEDVLGTSGTNSFPQLSGADVAGTVTFGSTRSIVWHRIGNIVFCTLRMALTGIPVTPEGTLVISGLPFTSASDTQELVPIKFHNVTLPSAGYTQIDGVINPSNTTITLTTSGFGKANVSLDAAALTTTSRFFAQFFYRAV